MTLINIHINKYFNMIPLWKSPIKLPVELPVGATRAATRQHPTTWRESDDQAAAPNGKPDDLAGR